ncbi:DUF5643 domain-containing protein [Paenibacillus sp. 481]|uniref:DUF5643 domain-containing protein n=1 Tax=Paenibacillus sp. 481 TaxID=2835869 RepID=UPI001E520FDD|nr:DUF5643 domain-containing protein [Paenibacillus sp. 481]UHA73495.1 hypothetical protein KIK04_23570 [Paenibacillus sp. 481]
MSTMNNTAKPKSNHTRKKITLIAWAVMLGVAIVGNGFPSYASAETAMQAAVAAKPAIDSNKTVTQGGVTLNLTKVLYDGQLLKITIQPERGTVDSAKYPVLSVEGKQTIFNAGFTTTSENTTAWLNYSIHGKLPDEFNMTLTLHANGVKEPFIFNIPMKKLGSLITLEPGITQKSGNFSYTVNHFEMTPLTTKLKLDSKGNVPTGATSKGSPSKMFYEIANEQGDLIQGNVSDLDIKKKPKSSHKEDLLYVDSFESVPKTITIKPYTYTIEPNGNILTEKNKFKRWVKTYYKDLEMKIVIPK